MDAAFARCCLLVLALVTISFAASVKYQDVDGKVAELVERIRRHATEEIHGHSMAVVHAEDPMTGRIHRLRKRDVLTHATHPSPSRRIALELASGDMINMTVTRYSIVTSGTTIVQRVSDDVLRYHTSPSDCFFAGPVENASGHAAVSLCGGELIGALQKDQRHFEIHPLPDSVLGDAGDLAHVVVTWADKAEQSEGSSLHRQSKREAPFPETLSFEGDFLAIPQEHDEDEDEASSIHKRSVPDDEGKWKENAQKAVEVKGSNPALCRDQSQNCKSRKCGQSSRRDKKCRATCGLCNKLCEDLQKDCKAEDCGKSETTDKFCHDTCGHCENATRRSIPDGDVVAEVGIFVDSFARQAYIDTYGEKNVDWFIKLALMKWSGVAAVMADPKLGRNITILIKHLEIWEENPSWYQGNEKTTISGRLGSICKGTGHMLLDHIVVWTVPTDTAYYGLTWISGACNRNYRCAAVKAPNIRFITELHEFGHSLGFPHEDRFNCSESDAKHEPAGFMGTTTTYARSCYKTYLEKYFSQESKQCLFWETSYPQATRDLRFLTPGQILGLDGQCKFTHGDEFTYFHNDEHVCQEFFCIANDSSKPNYEAVITHSTSKLYSATPCAPGRVCMNGECPPINQTSLSATQQLNQIVDGKWGPWSEFTPCTDSYGATSLKVSYRLCNNPEPVHGAYCQGDTHRAELCPSAEKAPIPEDNDVIARRIASDICQAKRDAGMKNYSGEGKVVKDIGDIESCRVSCLLSGSDDSWSQENYRMPDGLPCVGPNPAFDQLRGISRHCVNGKCMSFGCNDRTLGEPESLEKDVCGVCGGNGSDCVHGEYTGPLDNLGDRETVVILPVGATNIFIAHDYEEQRGIYLEIWTKDTLHSEPILSVDKGQGFNHNNRLQRPVTNFAGTFWHFSELQTLTAAGPLNQPVKITVHRSFERKVQFSRVFYRYTLSDTSKSVKDADCQNGGSPFAGGCSCPNGYYGLTCEHQCSLLCYNGILDSEACMCTCSNARQVGKDCKCDSLYGGEDCNGCASVRCKNGGVFNSTSCVCSCPANCGGVDCSGETCDDLGKSCEPAQCGQSVRTDLNCHQTCGHCKADQTVNGGRCYFSKFKAETTN